MWISELPKIMLQCLLLTILVETIIAIVMEIRDKRDILNIILVNIVTNPLVTSIPVFFEWQYGLVARGIALACLEVFALVFEGTIYYYFLKYKKINGFLISLILNASSYIIGEIINTLCYR